MHRIEFLKRLALLGAVDLPLKMSSSEFAEDTPISSKTAARMLKQLEDEELIDRTIVAGGQLVSLTHNGVNILRREYEDYRHIFSVNGGGQEIEMYGHVVTGLGEGQYYIGQEGYRKQFEEKLHFMPFPGTLNIRLTGFSVDVLDRKGIRASILISGFTDGERTFGACRCYPVEIEGIHGAVVVPERSHYPTDLLEIIAPMNLRKVLKLQDGDEVRVVGMENFLGE